LRPGARPVERRLRHLDPHEECQEGGEGGDQEHDPPGAAHLVQEKIRHAERGEETDGPEEFRKTM
jgi:hypothetical protein